MHLQKRVWFPIASRIAHAHGITINQLLWEGKARTFFIPRAIFWRTLHAFGRYSLPTIAAITGHDHTTVLGAINSRTVTAYLATSRPAARGELDLTARRFGDLTVVGPAPSRNDNPAWHCLCDCGRRETLLQLQLFDRGPKSRVYCFSPKLLRVA